MCAMCSKQGRRGFYLGILSRDTWLGARRMMKNQLTETWVWQYEGKWKAILGMEETHMHWPRGKTEQQKANIFLHMANNIKFLISGA